MKLAILHQLPLEYYPPATNAIQYFADRDSMRVLVVSSKNEKGRDAYVNDRVNLKRFRFGKRTDSMLQRWRHASFWHWQAAKALAEFEPDVLLYFEPHSALAATIYYRWFRGKARLFIHHHEYYTPSDYRQPGNRLTRINHFFERRALLPRADWVSQTNPDRLRFFQADHPEVPAETLHVLPNYPPQSWMAESNQSVKRNMDQSLRNSPTGKSSRQQVRLVYVGSVSLHDTYIGPLVDWLLANPTSGLTLDVFAYNTDSATREFLRNANGEIVRFHDRGVEYDDLPVLLRQFDVGVILYRCRTVNYQYNASNKLFEYLLCGLDVWYPPTMLGVKPYTHADAWPRVIEVNFDNMDDLDLNKLRSRDGLPTVPWTETCESQLAILEAEMRKKPGARK
ncbi:MAG: hypothetical protein NTX48_05535 [Planctomycetales bacterium]|nr:hypothetical protein [Planctomycetales bacterium]